MPPKIRHVDDINNKINYVFSNVGKFKKSSWSFQKEVRYIITVYPYGIPDLEKAVRSNCEINFIESRYNNPNISLPFSDYYLDIDDECFRNMQILLAPKISEGEKILVNSLIKEYCPSAIIEESKLKIR